MTKKDMLIHDGRRKWKDEFEVEKIVDHRGSITRRSYLIKWKGEVVLGKGKQLGSENKPSPENS